MIDFDDCRIFVSRASKGCWKIYQFFIPLLVSVNSPPRFSPFFASIYFTGFSKSIHPFRGGQCWETDERPSWILLLCQVHCSGRSNDLKAVFWIDISAPRFDESWIGCNGGDSRFVKSRSVLHSYVRKCDIFVPLLFTCLQGHSLRQTFHFWFIFDRIGGYLGGVLGSNV